MVRSFAETVQHHLIQTFPDNKSYSLSELAGPSIPHPIAHFLKRALHQRIQEIDLEIYPDWVDYENEDVKQKTEDWRRYLLKHARFPESVWEQTLRQAIRLVISYLIQPSLTLTKFVFGSEYGESDLKMAKERMSFFNVYPEFNRAVDEYILSTGNEFVARQEFSDLLAEVDRQVAESLADQAWIDKLDGLFNIAEAVPIMENSVSNDILLLLFDQKGRHDLARLVEKDNHEAYTRSELLQLLRSDNSSELDELADEQFDIHTFSEIEETQRGDDIDQIGNPSEEVQDGNRGAMEDLKNMPDNEEESPPFMNLIKGSGVALGAAGLASQIESESEVDEELKIDDSKDQVIENFEGTETQEIEELPHVIDERSKLNPGFVRRDIIESDIEAVEEEAERLGRRAPLPEDSDDPSIHAPYSRSHEDFELSELEEKVSPPVDAIDEPISDVHQDEAVQIVDVLGTEELSENYVDEDVAGLAETDNFQELEIEEASDSIVMGDEEIPEISEIQVEQSPDQPFDGDEEIVERLSEESIEYPALDEISSAADEIERTELDDVADDLVSEFEEDAASSEDGQQEIIHRHLIIPPIPTGESSNEEVLEHLNSDTEEGAGHILAEELDAPALAPEDNPFISPAAGEVQGDDAIPLWKKFQMEDSELKTETYQELSDPNMLDTENPNMIEDQIEEEAVQDEIREDEIEAGENQMDQVASTEEAVTEQTVLEKLTENEDRQSLHESFVQEEQARFDDDQSRLSPEERVLGNIHASRRAWYIYHLFGGDENLFKRFLSDVDSSSEKGEKMQHIELLVERRPGLGKYSAPVIAIRENIFGED